MLFYKLEIEFSLHTICVNKWFSNESHGDTLLGGCLRNLMDNEAQAIGTDETERVLSHHVQVVI